MNDKTHPTMKELYNKIHLIDPNIGQATVYRNINKLVEKDEIKKLSIKNEVDHYDGDLSNHYHFICTSCNKIVDIFDININIPKDNINNKYNVSIDNSDILLYGKCKDCIK